MITRTKFYREFKKCPQDIDFSLIRKEGINFIGIINSRNETTLDLLVTYTSAKRSFLNCLSHLKSFIDPKDNPLINHQSEGYKLFLGNIGRWIQIVDNLEGDITSINSNSNVSKHILQFDVQKFGEELISGFDVGIYGAIRKANLRFKERYIKKDGTEAVKDKNLYGYLVFYEFSNSADVFGGLSRMAGGERKNPGESSHQFSQRLPLPNIMQETQLGEIEDPFIDVEDFSVIDDNNNGGEDEDKRISE